MMRFTVFLLLVSMCMVGVVRTAACDEGKDPPAAPSETPEWKNPEGAARFAEGQAAYGEKRYKDARKLFERARESASGDEGRKFVESWVRAAAGGQEIEQMRAALQKGGKKSEVLAAATKSVGSYEGTPIHAEYSAFIAEIEKELYTVLDNFDRPSGRYSEKQGKKFIDDPKIVRQGSHCIEWKIVSNPAELRIKDVPKDLSDYRAVSFWFHGPTSGLPTYELSFMGKGKSAAKEGKETDNGYSLKMKCQPGWTRVEVPFKDFKQFGEMSWSSVEDFRIRVSGPPGATVYVDEVVLVKKE